MSTIADNAGLIHLWCSCLNLVEQMTVQRPLSVNFLGVFHEVIFLVFIDGILYLKCWGIAHAVGIIGINLWSYRSSGFDIRSNLVRLLEFIFLFIHASGGRLPDSTSPHHFPPPTPPPSGKWCGPISKNATLLVVVQLGTFCGNGVTRTHAKFQINSSSTLEVISIFVFDL